MEKIKVDVLINGSLICRQKVVGGGASLLLREGEFR